MSTTSQASQRINTLLDENSFVEIGALVTARATDFNLKQTETPSDGVITGYGVIDGNLVYVYSQDASVLNGTIGEMHAKKIANLYDLAVVPTLTDFTFMEEKKAKLFVNSPNAIDGNEISRCDTSSAAFQSEEAGIVDVVAGEADILAQIRELVSMLPANNEDNMSFSECADDLNRVCEGLENCAGDTSIALSQLSDNGIFFETKRNYAKDMVTGFIKLNGATVGAVANRSEVYGEEGKVAEKFDMVLSARGCEKAADFIAFCDAFDIPVLSLTNVKGFASSKCSEKKMAKAVARLTYAFANATVPKVNVITQKAYGSAYVAMNSKAIGADITMAWPDAEIGTMDAKLAAKIICDGQGSDAIDACAKEYALLQTSAKSAARRGYVDQIVAPEDTRKYVIGAFEMLYTKHEDRPAKKHGTV